VPSDVLSTYLFQAQYVFKLFVVGSLTVGGAPRRSDVGGVVKIAVCERTAWLALSFYEIFL
jgi:hypothetical protein